MCIRDSGECGPWLVPNFGSAVPGTRYDPAIMNGWGVRPYNWEFSASVQQELLPRLSATVGYFRRIQGNFYVQDNEALSRNDFTEFSATIPAAGSYELPWWGIRASGTVQSLPG